jgi:hypothetical protein
MTEEVVGPKAGQRGEPAWKEARTQVAERNKEARRAGKQRREAHERRQAEARQAEERRATSELLRRHPAR